MANSPHGGPEGTATTGALTYEVFDEMFPSDAACLVYLKNRFYGDGTSCPSCGRASRFHPIRGRSAYSCQYCGTHVYPTAGTVFHKTHTSLRLWFWAVFLIGSTRGEISTRELERELGVTYKTARRMLTRVSALLELEPGQDQEPRREAGQPEDTPASPAAPAWHRARRRG